MNWSLVPAKYPGFASTVGKLAVGLPAECATRSRLSLDDAPPVAAVPPVPHRVRTVLLLAMDLWLGSGCLGPWRLPVQWPLLARFLPDLRNSLRRNRSRLCSRQCIGAILLLSVRSAVATHRDADADMPAPVAIAPGR